MRRLEDVDIWYWNNGAGEINIPGKDLSYCGRESEMPDAARECYSIMNSIDSGPASAYTVSINGVTGVAFVWLFDKEYVESFGSMETAYEVLLDVADTLEDAMRQGKTYGEWLVGNNSDPCGHELMWFVYRPEIKSIPIYPYPIFEKEMKRVTEKGPSRKNYTVTMAVKGWYTVDVSAESFEQAKALAEYELSDTADFGVLSGLEGTVHDIEDQDGNAKYYEEGI